jgi:arginine exporter protein ArgO
MPLGAVMGSLTGWQLAAKKQQQYLKAGLIGAIIAMVVTMLGMVGMVIVVGARDNPYSPAIEIPFVAPYFVVIFLWAVAVGVLGAISLHSHLAREGVDRQINDKEES